MSLNKTTHPFWTNTSEDEIRRLLPPEQWKFETITDYYNSQLFNPEVISDRDFRVPLELQPGGHFEFITEGDDEMGLFEESEDMPMKSSGYGTSGLAKQVINYTFRDKINDEIRALEDKLSKKKEMLQLLDENPAIEKFMNLSRS